MNAPSPFQAPEGAVVWIPRVGWTNDPIEIDEHHGVTERMYVVVHGEVRVEDETLATVMRIDAERDDLWSRLLDVYEYGQRRLGER